MRSPYHEPCDSRTKFRIQFFKSYLRHCLPSGIFPSGFLTKILYTFSHLPHVRRAQSILSTITWPPKSYLAQNFIRNC